MIEHSKTASLTFLFALFLTYTQTPATKADTRFGLNCPGRWISSGGIYSCRCPNGRLAYMDTARRVICPTFRRKPKRPTCPQGQTARGNYCMPKGASQCPKQRSKHCAAPNICATDLKGKDRCFSKNALRQLNAEKAKLRLAKWKQAREDRNRKAEDDFAKTHGGLSYRQWLAMKRRQGKTPGKEKISRLLTALKKEQQKHKQKGKSYLGRMVDEANAKAHGFSIDRGSSDVDRALQGMAAAEAMGKRLDARIQKKNSPPSLLLLQPKRMKSTEKRPQKKVDTPTYPRAKPPCETSGYNLQLNKLLCDKSLSFPERPQAGHVRNAVLDAAPKPNSRQPSWVQEWVNGNKKWFGKSVQSL